MTPLVVMSDPETFAARLKSLVAMVEPPAKLLAWRELDRLAGLGENHAAQIANGSKARPTFETADALAGVLGAKPLWLLKGEGTAPSARTVCIAVKAAREAAVEKAKTAKRTGRGSGAAHPSKVRARTAPSRPRAR